MPFIGTRCLIITVLLVLLYLITCCIFVYLSVSVADLLSHSELDPDSDGSFTEEEAQVNMLFLYQQYHIKHSY